MSHHQIGKHTSRFHSCETRVWPPRLRIVAVTSSSYLWQQAEGISPNMRSASCTWKRTAQRVSARCQMCQPTTLLSFFSLVSKRRRRGGCKAELPIPSLFPSTGLPAKRKLQPQPQESAAFLLMLQHIGAEGWIDLLPAAQVRCSFMEQVTVARR